MTRARQDEHKHTLGMQWRAALAIVVSAAAAGAWAAPDYEMGDNGVVEADPRRFGAFVAEHADRDLVLMVFAPWGGHCKALRPRFDEAATRMRDDDGVVFAVMDGTLVQNVLRGDSLLDVDDRGIQGYPTVLFFPRGGDRNAPESVNPRTADGIIEFLGERRSTGTRSD